MIIIKKRHNNIIASKIETFFDVNGLPAVLSIFLSKLISIISLIIHPALLIKKAPKKKYTYHFISSRLFCCKLAKANQHGHSNNKNPMGLFNLIRSNKYLIFFVTILSNIIRKMLIFPLY